MTRLGASSRTAPRAAGQANTRRYLWPDSPRHCFALLCAALLAHFCDTASPMRYGTITIAMTGLASPRGGHEVARSARKVRVTGIGVPEDQVAVL
jgi:hypothetical protein